MSRHLGIINNGLIHQNKHTLKKLSKKDVIQEKMLIFAR